MRRLSVMDAFRIMGPAFLVSVALVDPGNWATAIEAGSKFGYELVWVVVASNLIAILLQTLAARLGIVTGKHLAQVCRESYPPQVCALLWVLCEISIVALDLTMLLGTAIGLNLLLGWPLLPCIVMTSLDALLLLLLVPAQGVKKSEALTVGLLAIVVACFLVDLLVSRPPLHSVVSGLLPRLRRDSVYTAVSLLGANVMPHNFYLHSALVSGQAAKASAAAGAAAAEDGYQGHIRALCLYNVLDIGAALGVALVINVAVLLVSAATFHSAGVVVHTLQAAHDLMEQTLSSSIAPAAFGTALLCAGQLSTFTGTIAGQVVLQGFLNIHISTWLRRLITRTAAIIPAAILQYVYGDRGTYKFLLIAQVVLALQLPVTLVPLIKATSSRQLMGCHASSRLTAVAAWAATGLVFLANLMLFMTQMLPEVSSGKGILDRDGPLDAWIDQVASLAYSDPLRALGLLGLLVVASAFLALQLWMIVTPLRVDKAAPLSSPATAGNVTDDGNAAANDDVTSGDEGPGRELPSMSVRTRGSSSGVMADTAAGAIIHGGKEPMPHERFQQPYRSGGGSSGNSFSRTGPPSPSHVYNAYKNDGGSSSSSSAAGGWWRWLWSSSSRSSSINDSLRAGMAQQLIPSRPFVVAQTSGTGVVISGGSSQSSVAIHLPRPATADRHQSLLLPLQQQQHHDHHHHQQQEQICWTADFAAISSVERSPATAALETVGARMPPYPVYAAAGAPTSAAAAAAATTIAPAVADGFLCGGWTTPSSVIASVISSGPRPYMLANTAVPDAAALLLPWRPSDRYHRRCARSYSSLLSSSNASGRDSNSSGTDDSGSSDNDGNNVSEADSSSQNDEVSGHDCRIRSDAGACAATIAATAVAAVVGNAADDEKAVGGRGQVSINDIQSSSSSIGTGAFVKERHISHQGLPSTSSSSMFSSSIRRDTFMGAVATAISTTASSLSSRTSLFGGQQQLQPRPPADGPMAAAEQLVSETDQVGIVASATAAASAAEIAATASEERRPKHPVSRGIRPRFATLMEGFWSTFYDSHGCPVWRAKDAGMGGGGNSSGDDNIRSRPGLHYLGGGGEGGSVGRSWGASAYAAANAMGAAEEAGLAESSSALPPPSSPLICSHAEGSHLCMGCSQALFEAVRQCLWALEQLEGVAEVMWGTWPLQLLLPMGNQTFHYHRGLLLAARNADFGALHALCIGTYSSCVDQSKLLASAPLLSHAAGALPPLAAGTTAAIAAATTAGKAPSSLLHQSAVALPPAGNAKAAGDNNSSRPAEHDRAIRAPVPRTLQDAGYSQLQEYEQHPIGRQPHHHRHHHYLAKRLRSASAMSAASLWNQESEDADLTVADVDSELNHLISETPPVWTGSLRDSGPASRSGSSSAAAAEWPATSPKPGKHEVLARTPQISPPHSQAPPETQLPGMGPMLPGLAVPTVSSWCVFGPAALVSFGVWSIFTLAQWCSVDSRPAHWGKYASVLNRLQGVLRDAGLDVTAVPLGAVVATAAAGDIVAADGDGNRSESGGISTMGVQAGRPSAGNQPQQPLLQLSSSKPSQLLPPPTQQQQNRTRYGTGQCGYGCSTKSPAQLHHHHQQQHHQHQRHPQQQLAALPATALRLCPEHLELLRRELLQQLEGMGMYVFERRGPAETAAGRVAFPKAKEIISSVMRRYRRRLGAAEWSGGGASGGPRVGSASRRSGGGAGGIAARVGRDSVDFGGGGVDVASGAAAPYYAMASSRKTRVIGQRLEPTTTTITTATTTATIAQVVAHPAILSNDGTRAERDTSCSLGSRTTAGLHPSGLNTGRASLLPGPLSRTR